MDGLIWSIQPLSQIVTKDVIIKLNFPAYIIHISSYFDCMFFQVLARHIHMILGGLGSTPIEPSHVALFLDVFFCMLTCSHSVIFSNSGIPSGKCNTVCLTMSLLLLIFITLFYYKWSFYVDFKVIFKSFLLVAFPEVTILVKGRNRWVLFF